MLEREQDNKVNKELDDSQYNAEKNQPFLKNINIPSCLNDIQPRATNICNCDEIFFDTKVRCNKVIFTHKIFQVKLMWKVKFGE